MRQVVRLRAAQWAYVRTPYTRVCYMEVGSEM